MILLSIFLRSIDGCGGFMDLQSVTYGPLSLIGMACLPLICFLLSGTSANEMPSVSNKQGKLLFIISFMFYTSDYFMIDIEVLSLIGLLF